MAWLITPAFILAIFLIQLINVALKEKEDLSGMRSIELRSLSSIAIFSIPSSYKLASGYSQLVSFTVKYPEMSPESTDIAPQKDSVHIYITLGNSIGRTAKMVDDAASRYGAIFPGQIYLAGEKVEYDIYRSFPGMDVKDFYTKTTYVFKATDGQLVGIDDIGGASFLYIAHRKIGKEIDLKYLIAKPIGNDFKTIDDKVSRFVKDHITVDVSKN